MELLALPLRAFTDSGNRLHLAYLGSAALIALVVAAWRVRSVSARKVLAEASPPGTWTHASAVLDYRWFIVSRIIVAVLSVGVVAAFGLTAPPVTALLEHVGPGGFVGDGWPVTLAVTAIVLISFDAGIYVGHRLFHEVPALWEFHKVHHSAQVLNPFTLYRLHPVDELGTGLIAVLLQGFVLGGVQWAVGGLPTATIWGVNALTFGFYLVGYNLRHSPMWVGYGPRVSRWLISPAMHQIHHSSAPEHYDTNYGLSLAVWDRLGHTLVVPTERLHLTFGLGEEEDRAFSSVTKLLTVPVVRLVGRIRDDRVATADEGDRDGEPSLLPT